MPSPDTFASDAEREAVADRLRLAAGEGRLTPDELSDRLGVAYSARTHGELEAVLAGLPEVSVKGRSGRSGVTHRLQRAAIYYLPLVGACILIWAFTGAEESFWPKWVILGVLIRLLVIGRSAALGSSSRPRPELPKPPDEPHQER